MAKMLIISTTTANDTQFVSDIVRTMDDSDSITAIEQQIFDVQQCLNVTRAEIDEHFNSQRVEDTEYPKFAFTLANLTAQNILDLANINVDHNGTLAIIETIVIKDPIN